MPSNAAIRDLTARLSDYISNGGAQIDGDMADDLILSAILYHVAQGVHDTRELERRGEVRVLLPGQVLQVVRDAQVRGEGCTVQTLLRKRASQWILPCRFASGQCAQRVIARACAQALPHPGATMARMPASLVRGILEH